MSTWRFYSFKDIDFRSRQPFRLIILLATAVRRDLVFLAVRAVRDRADLHVLRRILAFAMDFPAQT